LLINKKVFKAIKLKCLDCSGGSVNNVKECPCKDCTLYPYRLGEELNLFQSKGTGFKRSEEETPENE